MTLKRKRFKFKDDKGKQYRFTDDELITAWNIIERVDKVDTASLYLRNYCKLNADDYSTDEWWVLCATLCELYAEKFNGGANDAVWKSACDDFVKMYEKGEVI